MKYKLNSKLSETYFEGFKFTRKKTASGKFTVIVFAGNNQVFKTKPYSDQTSKALLYSDKFKSKIVSILKKEYYKTTGRKNPSGATEVIARQLESDNFRVDMGAMGMPNDSNEAFALGRIVGLKRGLDLCENRYIVTKWWERRKLKKKIQDDLNKWLDSLDIVALSAKLGIQGAAIPRVTVKGR